MNKEYSIQENKLLDCLEEENRKYKKILNSKELVLGKKTIKYLDKLKKMKLKSIFTDLVISKKIKSLGINKQQQIKEEKYTRKIQGSKIVVYTCITGSYDNIIEPNFKDYNCDYILFSDDMKKNTNSFWEIREIPNEIKKIENNILINRYIKMHPFELFENYDYAIYVDGNVRIISDVNSFIPFVNITTGLALHRHSRRRCLYKEAQFCNIVGKGKKDEINKEIGKIESNGMPKDFGLLECNFIVVDLKSKKAKKILDEWWNEFRLSEAYRDQIILPYIIWKNNLEMNDIGNLGNNIFENPKIRIEKH